MRRFVAIGFALVLASGCLPTRNSTPFQEGGNNNVIANNNIPDGANNSTPDGGNNSTADGGNNTANNSMPDAGNNVNNMPDGGDNNNLPDMPPPEDMCVPEDDTAFCARLGAECGDLSSEDNCTMPRMADCGGCAAGEECVNNMCEQCTPESDDAFCQRLGAECGEVSDMDNCMMPRMVNCGGCAGSGVGCNLENVCVEVVCDDDVDNDGAGGADCDDPNCAGMRCSPNPNQVCQLDGSCD